MDPSSIHLRHGSAKPLHAGHPWVFADAIERFSGPRPPSGAEVRVVDARGQVLGRGYYSPHSAIAVRLLTRGDEPADEAFLARRLAEALAWREELLGLGRSTTACRLVHSEGDGLGGFIADRYGEYICVAFGTAGMEARREFLLDALQSRLGPRGILDRGDPAMRRLERLAPPQSAPLRGEAPAGPVEVREDGLTLLAELRPGKGQKTGLFLDQRENRRRFGELARGRDVLDLFSYTGGFALHAARGGARSLTLADSSEPALKSAEAQLARNGFSDADLICADWPEALRHLRQEKRAFDLAAVDPPRFARSREAVRQALAAYQELNAQAARLLRPGGLLLTCSCSGSVPAREFERAVAAGLRQAGKRAAVLERRGAAPDHPVPPGFEQGDYLKCLVLRVS
jgi:23S rRNA (cytosine1962-C5)-methyltransferase